ncbi:Oidioi.mRNA.OKI2018_I69.chr2.g6460.t1.cds [Oikopleura dioica]|uniref:Oidioi.mRNA.OKI2018_I69.chr2.g6460.t1.cds n=1 Tax=Oikopleura dioica TaxID=34765 RepID=A0ABN7T361_OIKDI|nr:Oidioi.mRNA.OKI2018_I69.chr2.g6460.t1.cds [Oikopleura dioica]
MLSSIASAAETTNQYLQTSLKVPSEATREYFPDETSQSNYFTTTTELFFSTQATDTTTFLETQNDIKTTPYSIISQSTPDPTAESTSQATTPSTNSIPTTSAGVAYSTIAPTTTTDGFTTVVDNSLKPGKYFIESEAGKILSRIVWYTSLGEKNCVGHSEGKKEAYVVEKDADGFYIIKTENNSIMKNPIEYWKIVEMWSSGNNYVILEKSDHTKWMVDEVEDMDGFFYIRNSKPAYGEDDVVAITNNSPIALRLYSSVGSVNRVKFIPYS